MKNLWLLLTSSSFLWVAWVVAYIHKGRSLFKVDSWCLCAIMCKQDSLKEHVQMEVGDGRHCKLCLDPLLKGGPILQQVGERALYNVTSR